MKKSSDGRSGIDSRLASYGDRQFSRYLRRAFLASAGYDRHDLERPIVGIASTVSDYNTCHRDMPAIVKAVKRGVLEAGGLPLAFPTISLNEIVCHPTTMLYRNLMAIDTEEMLKSHPMDSVVLLGGCDKTLPAQLMAAVSANIPALCVATGPMLTRTWRGQRLGASTDCRRYWASYRAGEIGDEEIAEIEASLCATGGTCMVMGTASTMACLAEVMGMMLPYGATAPSPSGERLRIAAASGRQAVALGVRGIRPRAIVTKRSIRNALIALAALGGSTNAVIHLAAIARRAGVSISPAEFNTISEAVPLLVNCKPAGSLYMEDFHYAGGVPGLLRVLSPLLDTWTKGVTGKRLRTLLAERAHASFGQNVLGTLERPLGPTGALVMLEGSLAPDGAVIKAAAATPSLLTHTGPAIVFESAEDLMARIDDPALGIRRDHVLVLRNAGPAACGMPEVGSFPIPRYLARSGVKDMVRVTDGRMSGTAFGTVVLHCSPEAARGGPLSLVRDGDIVSLDARKHRIDILVSEAELEARRKRFRPPAVPRRGWARLHAQHVLQANLGADLDFLV